MIISNKYSIIVRTSCLRRSFKLENAKNISKYIIAKNFYLDYINKKELTGGELLPSELEVSKKLEFSRDTVRRALNELEKEGYINRERGRGTFYTRPKKRFEEKRVAILTTYVRNYIFPSIISGIEEVVSAKHYTLTLANTNNDPALERKHLRKIIDSGVDGLIIEPTKSVENKNKDLYQEIFNAEIPFIMINAMYKDLNTAYVILDDLQGGYMATKYVLQLGHRKIAGIFKKDDLQGVYRKKGFVNALEEYGINPDEIDIGGYLTNEASSYSYYYADKIINSDKRPTAIVCYNDEIAVKVIDAINDNGLSIPEDISVVGYDDSVLATTGGIRLTSIKHPKVKMGKKAARLLFNMIEMDVEQPSFIYEPELIVRSSCREI
ncbi:MAG: GntR family transcriptional regulator [Firmicutes bacterium]|nr:GntR family transcriptional regulator [Bacillota bacterium]